MKFTLTIVPLAFAAFAAAQVADMQPAGAGAGAGIGGGCSISCATQASSEVGCNGLADAACFCKKQDFVTHALDCIQKGCAAQQSGAVGVFTTLCQTALGGNFNLSLPQVADNGGGAVGGDGGKAPESKSAGGSTDSGTGGSTDNTGAPIGSGNAGTATTTTAPAPAAAAPSSTTAPAAAGAGTGTTQTVTAASKPSTTPRASTTPVAPANSAGRAVHFPSVYTCAAVVGGVALSFLF